MVIYRAAKQKHKSITSILDEGAWTQIKEEPVNQDRYPEAISLFILSLFVEYGIHLDSLRVHAILRLFETSRSKSKCAPPRILNELHLASDFIFAFQSVSV